MAQAEPVHGGKDPGMQGVKWAIEYTGLSKNTVHRRLNAYLAGDRSPYAFRASLRNVWRGDRLADMVDAERVRLQHQGRLAPEVTCETWPEMVRRREVPWEYVTDEPWFRGLVGEPPPG